nr:MAG TPA: hypothetical protein [Caudoviricetes sp.]
MGGNRAKDPSRFLFVIWVCFVLCKNNFGSCERVGEPFLFYKLFKIE